MGGRDSIVAMQKAEFAQVPPADYLRRVADSGAGRSYKSVALNELRIGNAHEVIDLGCGPGTDLPEFASSTGPDGVVIGLDHDREAVSAAAAAVQMFPWARVRVADIHETGMPSASADRVHTDRVLQHVTDPAAVVREARRLLRPSGIAVFVEPDWDTLILDYPDTRIAQAYRLFITERVIRNAAIGRALSRLSRQAGFMAVTTTPVTLNFTDAHAADELLGLARVTRRAVQAGYLDEPAAADWLDYLATETFFASVTLFVVTASA